MLDKLIAAHFQVDFRSHAKAILEIDFPEVAEVTEDVLLGSTIPIEEIIRSGGGETKGTQRLRNALRAKGWDKHTFIVERTIDGVPREAQSHESITSVRWPPERLPSRSNGIIRTRFSIETLRTSS